MPRNFPVVGVGNDKQNEELPLLPFGVSGRCICLGVPDPLLKRNKKEKSTEQLRCQGDLVQVVFVSSGWVEIRFHRKQNRIQTKGLPGFRVLFKGEKQFSAMNCPSFTSVPGDATLFYNYPCLHVGSLNHSYAAGKVGFCQCGFRCCLFL